MYVERSRHDRERGRVGADASLGSGSVREAGDSNYELSGLFCGLLLYELIIVFAGQRVDADSNPRERRPAVVEGAHRMTTSTSTHTVSRRGSDESERKRPASVTVSSSRAIRLLSVVSCAVYRTTRRRRQPPTG